MEVQDLNVCNEQNRLADDNKPIGIITCDELNLSNSSDSEISDKLECDNSKKMPTLQEVKINSLPKKEEKVRQWALNNIGIIHFNVVSEMLAILQSEGYHNLPSNARQLLGYKHTTHSKPIAPKKKTVGQYVYLGIRNALEKRITKGIYDEDTINILVYIDGMSVYRNSNSQLWPILVNIHHKKYNSKPLIAALFHGNSKPLNLQEYLGDFVKECISLINNGITLHDRKYKFRIAAVIADAPARAFIKATKGPTAYYGCWSWPLWDFPTLYFQ